MYTYPQYYYLYKPYNLSYQPYYRTNYTNPLYSIYFHPTDDISKSELMLSNWLRKLWEQHTVWTKSAIVSLVFNLPDANFVINRLLQNPVDFGNLFTKYYGIQSGNKFRDLIREHLVIAADLVKASKAGNTEKANEIERKWYANADEIARFLASINPYWSMEKWQRMYYEHLGLVKNEAVILLTKNYAQESLIYDRLETQALEMADMMLQGITRQFPSQFI